MEIRQFGVDVCRNLGKVLSALDEGQLSRLADGIDQASRVFVLGRGRSGNVMSMFAMRLMHLGITAYVVGETNTPSISADDLLIIGSGSGRTATCTLLATVARVVGAKVVLITAEPEPSPVAAQADEMVLIPVETYDGNDDRPQQFGGTYFEQALLVVSDAIIEALRQKRGVSYEVMKRRHANLE